MENYTKGKNVEEELTIEKIPIPNLPKDFLWMHVKGGTKIRNVLSYALTNFSSHNAVVWSGSGPAVGKTVSCVELMKRECNEPLHQISKICFRLVEEYWDPLTSDLDQIVVKRNLPVIHILLSKKPLDANELGYQPPLSIQERRVLSNNETKQGKQNCSNRRRKFSNTPSQKSAL